MLISRKATRSNLGDKGQLSDRNCHLMVEFSIHSVELNSSFHISVVFEHQSLTKCQETILDTVYVWQKELHDIFNYINKMLFLWIWNFQLFEEKVSLQPPPLLSSFIIAFCNLINLYPFLEQKQISTKKFMTCFLLHHSLALIWLSLSSQRFYQKRWKPRRETKFPIHIVFTRVLLKDGISYNTYFTTGMFGPSHILSHLWALSAFLLRNIKKKEQLFSVLDWFN